MKVNRPYLFTILFFCLINSLTAQSDTINPQDLSEKGIQIGISEAELIEQMMVTIPGLGSNSREMLMEQSVKPYMMPPRKAGQKEEADSYALAACLEFYQNYRNNYKVNLSPDYINLNLKNQENQDLRNGFAFLINDGTVSAAIMPYEAASIPAAVFATQKFKINNYLHIFRTSMKGRHKVFEAKKALMRGNPVIFEMQVPENFDKLEDSKFWLKGSSKPAEVHPFVVVSYDQDLEAFEIMSSWGSDWGSNGFLWVDFEDFGKWAMNGYVMVPDGEY